MSAVRENAGNTAKVKIGIGVAVVAALVLGWFILKSQNSSKVSNFAECAAAGNPIMESYPEQCRANGKTYVNEVNP